MITTVLCYSTTSGIAVADYGKPSRVDMGNVGLGHGVSMVSGNVTLRRVSAGAVGWSECDGVYASAGLLAARTALRLPAG